MVSAKTYKMIQAETCITRDKITRYRGILKLYARDKKLQLLQATKLKSTVSRKLASLEVDVRKHREIVGKDLSEGGKKLTYPGADCGKFCLAISQLQASEIYAAIFHNSDIMRQLLNKLYYEKNKKLKHAIELQLEYSDLSNECKEENGGTLQLHCEQQQFVAQLQRSISKYNTAKAIRSIYLSILHILQKDAMFFDTLLNMLKEDQFSQCKAMLRMTVMGQLATENLDDVRQKYKRMTGIILRNMRIREQTLNSVRCQVQDLWSCALSLVRVESDTVFSRKDIADELSSADEVLEKQLISLENICDRIKETLLVRSYHDLLSSYKAQECEILEQIEIEKKREKDLKELKKIRGELFTNIRAALQNINMMLLCVRQSDTKDTTKKKDVGKDVMLKKESNYDQEDTELELESLAELEEVDTDVLVLLAKITRKISILYNMSNFDLKKEKEYKARYFYQTYVSDYNSNWILGSIEGKELRIGLYVEHEMIDATVPTRDDVKFRSRQIIEAHI
ncbi:PREDICTED: uncharacterized protein LOC106751230 isoform X2 [Dinoponera quadriceps]|uniref:Uncharacterized protein LOC106751230 isoform X2 n=1 Tax=Dinoponera quadriceps TaxID=609295 RepID=A0A6P3YB41_DINQU|nr:PREDICTED: uncharacterized protein LOC106751230 isoform X2 [Dinoponera quadriceps]